MYILHHQCTNSPSSDLWDVLILYLASGLIILTLNNNIIGLKIKFHRSWKKSGKEHYNRSSAKMVRELYML